MSLLSPKTVNQIDRPEEFKKIAPEQQRIVIEWIKGNLLAYGRANTHHTSYGLKHIFERDPIGFYMTNGEFKGAMIASGFQPVVADDLNCCYKISKKSPAFNREG